MNNPWGNAIEIKELAAINKKVEELRLEQRGEIEMDKCVYCKKQHTMDCPNSQYCYSTEAKPYFELRSKYKSKLICKGRTYYNIHHFNKFQKLLAKIIWKIKIEDVE